MTFENYTAEEEKEIIPIFDFEKRINRGEDIDDEEILLELPNGKILTYMEYIEGGYHMKYSTMGQHTKTPMDKLKRKVPSVVGSNKKGKFKYWENM